MPDIESDQYITISGRSEGLFKDRGSKFIAIALPAENAEKAMGFLEEIKKEYHAARHHCYAYRLLQEDRVIERSDDDGEPAGSAGLPILQQLQGADLLNALLVVTRYFGGTKLGVGGLVRAYGEAARSALDGATILEKSLRVEVSIAFPIEVNSSVMATIHRQRAEIVEIGYERQGRVRVRLAPSGVEAFRRALVESTGDRVHVEVCS